MQHIEKPAVIAASIGPFQSVLGWLIAGAMWPGYDPVRQTISDLAANESPVKWLMSSFFILGGTLSLIGAWFARSIPKPARAALFISGLCTYGLTIFPTPLVGHSDAHRFFAITSFFLSSVWPLFAITRNKKVHWILRPAALISATIFLSALAGLFMVMWADPATTTIGVWERAVTTSQSLLVSMVVLVLYRAEQASQNAIHTSE
ncbi:MAG: hypothetical protein RL410_890 [Actinomycetota bacterium]|jgi:hypothetical membrane protein